jgi:hypothetical protein
LIIALSNEPNGVCDSPHVHLRGGMGTGLLKDVFFMNTKMKENVQKISNPK